MYQFTLPHSLRHRLGGSEVKRINYFFIIIYLSAERERKKETERVRGGGEREAGNALEHCPLNWVLAHIISPKPALTQRQTTNELRAAEDAVCKERLGERRNRGEEEKPKEEVFFCTSVESMFEKIALICFSAF